MVKCRLGDTQRKRNIQSHTDQAALAWSSVASSFMATGTRCAWQDDLRCELVHQQVRHAKRAPTCGWDLLLPEQFMEFVDDRCESSSNGRELGMVLIGRHRRRDGYRMKSTAIGWDPFINAARR